MRRGACGRGPTCALCVCPRLSEPDPSHTLEERVVHWYFKLLDKNSSGDIGKKEIKPFKRFLRKKSKPKKCVKRFVDYCDANNDKSLSVHELMGCLGVTEEEGRGSARKRHSKAPPPTPPRPRPDTVRPRPRPGSAGLLGLVLMIWGAGKLQDPVGWRVVCP